MKMFEAMQSAKRSVNRQSGYRKLGSAEIAIAFSSDDAHRVVEFDAFKIGEIRTVEDPSELRGIGVRIRMSNKQWSFYLRRRMVGKLPTLIAFNLDQPVLEFAGPFDRLHFLRVHKSIQAFVDAWARHSGP
ncbi:MAG: hypothetical protein OXG08_08060 [Gammaproteobacteria bacterium]|nr:hypothetical protein [Gammaproteobacteria bacterium]